MIAFLWAIDHPSKNVVIKHAVFWSRRLYTLQLGLLALTQIAPIIEPIKESESLYNFMFVSGFILNSEPAYAVT